MTRKRAVWVVASLLLAMVVLAIVAQRQVGEFLFDRAISQRIGRDISTELPDGLHVFMCGTGAPLADSERAGPCIAVLAGKHGFVFESGSGSTRKLGAMAFPLDKLDALFLSHLHSDHIDGMVELLLQAWIGGSRDKPLPVYGPTGVDRVVGGFGEAYTVDRGLRVAHHGTKVANPAGFGGDAPSLFDGRIVTAKDGMIIMPPRERKGDRFRPAVLKKSQVARVTGLEPATSGVTGRHSNQLSYTRALSGLAPLGSSAPSRRLAGCQCDGTGFFGQSWSSARYPRRYTSN